MSVEDIARLFEAHPFPVIGLYEDGRCAFANPALLLLVGEEAGTVPDPAAVLGGPGEGAGGRMAWPPRPYPEGDGQEWPVRIRRADGKWEPAAARGGWVAAPGGTRLFIVTLTVGGVPADGTIAHSLLNAINEAVIIADRDHRILYVNEAACLRYGYTPEEFGDLTIDAIVSPTSANTPARLHAGLFARKSAFFANEHITRRGQVIPVEVSTRAIIYHGVPAIMSVSRDITSRREEERTRQAFEESEEKYRVLFESAGDAIFITDTRGIISRVNDRMAHMLGYSKDRFAGMPLEALLAGDDASMDRTFETILEAGSLIYLAAMRAADRTVRKVEILSRTIPYEGATAVLSIARDISRRRELEEKLHLSEEMYRAIFANSGAGIIILDRSDEIILGNAEAVAILDPGPAGLAGRVWTEFVDDPLLLRFVDVDMGREGFEEFRIRNYETECLNGSGGRVPCILSVSPIPGAGRYIVTLQDMRKNRAMVASIRERQQLLDEIFRSAHDGFILLDEHQTVQIWNRGAERITGYAGDEMAGRPFGECPVFGEDGRLFGEDIRHLLTPGDAPEGGGRNRADLRLLTRRGAEKECEMTVSFVQRAEGTSTLCIVRDVTRQKAILDALTRNEEYLRLVIDSANLGTWDWRPGEEMIAVSPDMFDVLGYPYTAEWVAIDTVSTLTHPDDREVWEQGMQAFAAGGTAKEQTEVRMRAADGRYLWFALEGSAAEFGDDGATRRVVGIMRDITGEKQAEQALREANKKLSVLSGITRHDILNQIQGLLFYSEEIIHGDYTDEEKTMMAEKILAASETINRQISFTRNYDNLGAEPPEWQNLSTIITETKGELPPGMPCTITVPPVGVYADKLFAEALRAIFENIRTHAEGATEVTVSFAEREGSGVLTIADDGCGIPAGQKARIFTHSPSTGNNSLFLAQEIAGVTGISITETGTEGKGAVFEVAFPKTVYRMESE
ncbi:hypothetical protein AZH53_09400 [Methanomicrobiaceae archaeon CYW5]|uniref:PAS domain S-box protein n=1 Tax=Methanovulcanius yangii TaxID=1789227 RepID=UPI0029C9F8CC|nr:PAS domain S-box protein [Methanovulcanius yangii]MBT8508618.1 hypothetical protein [Methanovulcanius yangii]